MTIEESVIEIKQRIKDVYIQYKHSLVVGYSGGKDSTLVLDLVIESLLEIYSNDPKTINKRTYIITSDTLIENPFVSTLINQTFTHIQKFKNNLKIELIRVNPRIEDSFWVSIIGKGYPLPLNRFRWCTRQLKINPMQVAIQKIFEESQETISVLGLRIEESSSRKKKMEDNSISGNEKDFFTNSEIENNIIFAPIYNLKSEDIWKHMLKKKKSEWGLDYGLLYEMYWETSKECPMVLESSMIDDSPLNCGKSRWGCWMCPLSSTIWLDNMVSNGLSSLKPLAEFRKWMMETRDSRENRYLGRHLMINKPDGSLKVFLSEKGFIKLHKKEESNNIVYSRPKKGLRKKLVLKPDGKFLLNDNNVRLPIYGSEVYKTRFLNEPSYFYSEKGSQIDAIYKKKDELFIAALGPYTLTYRIEVLTKLLSLHENINREQTKTLGIDRIDIISLDEIEKIFDLWLIIAKYLNKTEFIVSEILKLRDTINKVLLWED